jgi:hypothetical protein
MPNNPETVDPLMTGEGIEGIAAMIGGTPAASPGISARVSRRWPTCCAPAG